MTELTQAWDVAKRRLVDAGVACDDMMADFMLCWELIPEHVECPDRDDSCWTEAADRILAADAEGA